MTKREKIIVTIGALVVIIWALFNYNTFFKETMGLIQPRKSASESIAESEGIIGKQDAFQRSLYTIGLAANKVGSERFIARVSNDMTQVSANIEKAGIAPKFAMTYTGFMHVGSGFLAIIDGLEYGIGDAVGSSGYTVKTIGSDMVILDAGQNMPQQKLSYVGD